MAFPTVHGVAGSATTTPFLQLRARLTTQTATPAAEAGLRDLRRRVRLMGRGHPRVRRATTAPFTTEPPAMHSAATPFLMWKV